MSGTEAPKARTVRVFRPAPSGFDAVGATKKELVRHGIPPRPDPKEQPDRAALWEKKARLYRDFEHLEPDLSSVDAPPLKPGTAGAIFLPEDVSCGFELISSPSQPFVLLSGTWTVPNLGFTSDFGSPNKFHTFIGLGFDVDVHVEMTVDAARNVTSQIVVNGNQAVNLPVGPGDAISATLCLNDDNPAKATAFCGLANETTLQTVNFNVGGSGIPSTHINAGIGRTFQLPPGANPLARFGVVYFDELIAFTTGGQRNLTSGTAVSMINEPGDGSTLARPFRLNDFAFKVVREGG
jgi:Peptidase A4 family